MRVLVPLVMIVVVIVAALLKWGPRAIDYGACLASHTEHRHEAAHLAPAFGLDGEITLTFVEAKDWDVVVCDQWEFPTGRMEQADQ